MRKGEIACNKQFLLSLNVFYPIWYLFFILNALLNVVCIFFFFFQFGPAYNFVVGNWLNHSEKLQFKITAGVLTVSFVIERVMLTNKPIL